MEQEIVRDGLFYLAKALKSDWIFIHETKKANRIVKRGKSENLYMGWVEGANFLEGIVWITHRWNHFLGILRMR